MERIEQGVRPSCEEAEKLGREYDRIPLCREIYADVVTPITLLRKIASRSARYFLLESIEGGERWGRYSFLGMDPCARVRYKNGVVRVEGEDGADCQEAGDPYDVLRGILRRRRAPKIPGLPPFAGGLVGTFSYEMIACAEPALRLPESDVDDLDLMLFEKVISYDHLTQKISVVVNMHADGGREGYRRAAEQIDELVRLIADPMPLTPQTTRGTPSFTCDVTREAYGRKVESTKEYIRAGDIFQAVVSRRFTTPYQDSLLGAYRVLRTTNPSPYMVFLQADDLQVMCSSPETLVRLQDGRLSTFPVAGSRPRGKDAAQDEQFARELLADEKECAEHNMLVDLARNDLGRVARYGSVQVTEYQSIHRYSRIMHITSVVEGDLREGCDAFDAIRSILPAGTLSGAPKIRACEIIAAQEGAPRGIYGGAIGYIDFTGNMDTCIAIRMAVRKNGTVTVQAGGGIVADSVPDKEYEESGTKARAVIEAIERASEVDDR